MKAMKAWQWIEKGWCRHVSAQDTMGGAVSPSSKTAVSFCLMGALARVYKGVRYRPIDKLIQNELRGSLSQWNDAQRTARPVIALLKRLNL